MQKKSPSGMPLGLSLFGYLGFDQGKLFFA